MPRHIAIYVRVSSKAQDCKSQLPDLEAWAKQQEQPVEWYHDQFTGKTTQRPGWQQLDEQLRAGKLSAICCWRMDRLGRVTTELCRLFDQLRGAKVDLICLRDGLTLNTPAGRHFARTLASASEYDNEVRSERIRAGQAVAKQEGKRWGGSNKGRRKASKLQCKVIRDLRQQKTSLRDIAKAVGLSRGTITRILAD